MSDIRIPACWRDDAVLATTPRDAASLGDGHFQAIHHPLRLRRQRIDKRGAAHWVTEQEIVDALRGSLRPDGYLFIPIVGGSGTGKSHLVRWVKDQAQGISEWEARYLPKNRTGIRQAIEIVIRGLTGPRIDEAREALEAAPAHNETDEVLAERLLDELALLVARADDLPSGRTIVDKRRQQLRGKLERQLPDVLRDPVVRRKLVEPGGVVQRLVGLTVRGRQDGDGLDDDATRFLESDLPLTFDELSHCSRGAQQLLRQLATIPDLKDEAVELINDALPVAEKRVSLSGHVDLVEIFREVRRSLFERRKDLVLFVEDLTVLHGVEREFLDAIVEPVDSEGGRMCSLRVIFAVTEGHFEFRALDTVRTRCEDAYWLDARYGEDGVDLDEALSFLGRYLNASRLQPETIETAWSQRHDDSWLTNACTACEYRETCHNTFGTSAEGYGLFPLNRSSAERFVSALSETRFDPRDVVREVINRFLRLGHVELRDGAFPSDNTVSAFHRNTNPLPPLLAAEIRSSHPIDHERIINVLRYWSDPGSPTSLPGGTLAAFGVATSSVDLDSLGRLVGATTTRQHLPGTKSPPRRKQSELPDTPDGRLPRKWRGIFAELDKWPSGTDLSAQATNELRKLIHGTVLGNLELGAVPVHLGPEFSKRGFEPERHVALHGTITKQSLDAAVIVIERTQTNAAALQGLILLAQLDEFAFSEAASYQRRVAHAVEKWTSAVSSKVLRTTSPNTTSAVESAILAAAILGLATGARTAQDFLQAAFTVAGEAPQRAEPRSERWANIEAQARQRLPSLRAIIEAEFGESRGVRGNVRAIQADRLLPIIEDFVETWRLESADPSLAPFVRSVTPAVEEEWNLLVKRVNEALPHVDRDRSWSDQTEKVVAVLQAAFGAGRLPNSSVLDDLKALATVRTNVAQKALFEARDLLAKDLPIQGKLLVVASQVPDDVAVVHRFVSKAVTALDAVERDLKERQAVSGGATNVEDAVERVRESTARLLDTAKEMAG